jgi:hypothetical protein
MTILRPVYARKEAPGGAIFSARFPPQMSMELRRFIGGAAVAISTDRG